MQHDTAHPRIRPLAVIYATLAEAQPLIDALRARPLGERPYAAFHAPRRVRVQPVVIAITGMGLAAAEAGVDEVLARERPSAVINAGIAGALHGRFSIGEVLRVDGVAESDREAVASDEFQALDVDGFAWLARAARPVRLISRRDPLFDVDVRDRLAATADLVDMEGARIARRCARAGLPCALVKAVSDHASDRATLLHHLEHGARRLAEHLAPPLRRPAVMEIPT